MIDRNDSTWAEVEASIKTLLDEAISALKSPTVSWDQVQIYRGKILAFEELLAMPEKPPAPEPATPDGYF